jgi:hypothetical protein
MLQGRSGVVADSRDPSLAEIENGERFQDVVQLSGGEVDVDILAAANVPGVFEVSDTVLVENDPGYRQAR